MRRKETRQTLKNFLENVPLMYFAVGKNGKIVSSNRSFRERTGYSEEKILNEQAHKLFDESSGKDFLKIVKEYRSAGELDQWKLKDKMGNFFRVHYNILKNSEDENILHCLLQESGNGSDVTEFVFEMDPEAVNERIRAEQYVKYSKEQFGELYDNIPVGIYKTTPGGEVIMANNTFYEILGLSLKDRSGNLDLNKLLKTLKYHRRRFIEEVERANTIKGFEDRITGIDGKQRFLRENARAVRDAEGHILYYEGTVVDITALRKTQKELRKSEIEKSAILNSMQEWFIFCDTRLIIRWASPVAASSMGMNINDILDKHYDEVWDLTQWDCDHCPVKAVIESEEPLKSEVRTKDGRTWVLSCYPVKDDDGLMIGVTEFGQEITVQRKYEEELRKARDMAEKANQFKNEFLSNISHEIRTPLNVIIGFTDLLDNSLMDPTYKDYLESIKASSNSIVRLVDDILDISKIEAGKFNLQYKSVDLYKLIKDVKQMFIDKVANKQLDFLIQIEKSIPKYLIMDEVRIKQVLTNLISNAVKYTDRGHVRLKIDLTGRSKILGSEEVDLRIVVEDSGVGIPEEEYDKIFEPFMQVKKNKSKRMGYGLGLAITRRLVELMDGSVTVESEVGKGSVFTVNFPQIMVQSYTLNTNAQAGIPTGSYRDKTVLIVDDSDFNRRLVRENLENLGVRIIEAVDGHEAIIFAEEHKPDLILMDILMPRMDGFEATKIIRGNPELSSIPILALTALAMKEDVEKIESFGFDDYLLKPFHITDLLDKIKPLVANAVEAQGISDNSFAGEVGDIASGIDPAKLSDAIEFLEKEMMEEWKEVAAVKEFSSIKRFAEKILSIGASGQVPEVIEYGEDLFNYSKDYDVESIDTCLEAFPLLIEKLNNIRKDLDGQR